MSIKKSKEGGEDPIFDKFTRFRSDYANAYSAHLMFLGMGKDLEYVNKYFPILKFNEYSEQKIRQAIATESNIKPEEIQEEVEKRLASEAQKNNKTDLEDIEKTDRLVDEVNNEYQESLNKLSANPEISKEEKDNMKNSIIKKLKIIDDVVKKQ